MKFTKKNLFYVIFLLAVLLLTFWSVLRGESIPDLLRSIAGADKTYLILAVICVLLFLCGQGVVIYLMLQAVNMKRSFWKCLLFSFTGYFFCSITPFQSGGPPIQVVNMKKEGVPMATGSIVILVMTFLFKVVLVVAGILYVIFGQRLIGTYLYGLRILFGIGLFLTIGFCFLLYMFIFQAALTRKVALIIFDWFMGKWLGKKLIRSPERARMRLDSFLERYKQSAVFFKTHVRLMIVLFLITAIQRFFYFLTAYFVYRAFGLSGTPMLIIVFLMSVISISADLLPLPGGVGISEAMFLKLFRPVFGAMRIPGMVLTRGITYYVQLIFCGVMTAAAHFMLGRGRKDQEAV